MVDDIGQLPAGQEAAEASTASSTPPTSGAVWWSPHNLHPPRGFETIMSKGLATAAVDRLLHHAHVVITEGTSTRLTGALAGKG